MEFDEYGRSLDPAYNKYVDELNASKKPFEVEDEHGNTVINPELLKYIEELEFYIIENRVDLGGSLINFHEDFRVVKEDLTHRIDIEGYTFYEKDKHMQINLVEVYADSVFAAIEINDEIYRLMKEIQKFIMLF